MPSLFARLLGDAMRELPEVVRRVHDDRPHKRLAGRCDVERGRNWLSRLVANVASLPPSATDIPITVSIDIDAAGEVWSRNFNGHLLKSRLWEDKGLLAERLGPVTLRFRLGSKNGSIEWRVASARYRGLPMPARWFANTNAAEHCIDGDYVFDVRASLPLVGVLVRYRGWLKEHD